MKTNLLKNVRMWTIGLFAMACLVCIVSEPINEEQWFKVFLQSKLLGVAFGAITYFLFKYWDSKGLLPELKDEDLM